MIKSAGASIDLHEVKTIGNYVGICMAKETTRSVGTTLKPFISRQGQKGSDTCVELIQTRKRDRARLFLYISHAHRRVACDAESEIIIT